MLHRINDPHCKGSLEWIVKLQRLLLDALCQPTVTREQVTEQWAKDMTAPLGLDGEWVDRFCARKDGISRLGRPVIEHMQTIADLSPTMKAAIVSAFDDDQQFFVDYDNPAVTRHTLRGLDDLKGEPKTTSLALRGFLESFYNPTIYRKCGYLIPQPDGAVLEFDKDKYVDSFEKMNGHLSVCPFCDGHWNGQKEVDHFFPRSKFPQLSCHSENLVPLCHDCNSPSVKRAKVALDLSAADPAMNWYHPYRRSAEGAYQVELRRRKEGLTPVLASQDAQSARRLKNLSELLQLEARWRKELAAQMMEKTQIVMTWRRRNKGVPISREELVEQLQKWAVDAEAAIRRRPHALVEVEYLRKAATEDPDTFDELWVCAGGGDTVTGV